MFFCSSNSCTSRNKQLVNDAAVATTCCRLSCMDGLFAVVVLHLWLLLKIYAVSPFRSLVVAEE